MISEYCDIKEYIVSYYDSIPYEFSDPILYRVPARPTLQHCSSDPRDHGYLLSEWPPGVDELTMFDDISHRIDISCFLDLETYGSDLDDGIIFGIESCGFEVECNESVRYRHSK